MKKYTNHIEETQPEEEDEFTSMIDEWLNELDAEAGDNKCQMCSDELTSDPEKRIGICHNCV